jgi:hypothetical protein
MKKCLILFGEYRGRREAIEWDSENLPDDWDSIISTWNSTSKYSHEDLFLDTKHRTIIEPYKETHDIFLFAPFAMCNRIIKALESITEDYEYIVIKRLDLLWKDVFTHISDSQNKIWVEKGADDDSEWLNDYIFVGQKDELLHLFKSSYDYIETNNPPRMKDGLPYVHKFWYKMSKEYIPHEPIKLFSNGNCKYKLLTQNLKH